MQQFIIGGYYRIDHVTRGQCELRITAENDEGIAGMVTEGILPSTPFDCKREPGDIVHLRKSNITAELLSAVCH